MTTPLYSHEMLAETAAAASHMTELLEKLGVENTNGKRRAMWARLRRTGIDISHWDRSPRAGGTPMRPSPRRPGSRPHTQACCAFSASL